MRGYLNNKSIKLGINKNTRNIRGRKNVNSLIYNNTTVPQVTHFYYSGKQKVSQKEIIIPIYFTDWYQREYYYDDKSLNFNLRLEIDGNISYIKNVKAGDYDLSLGILTVGEHEFNIEIEDIAHKLKSQRLFNKIWIVDDSNDIKETEIYNVTLDDLSNYNITLDLDESATSEQLTNNRHGLTSLFEYYHKQGYRKIILPKNSYIRINMQIADETETDIRGKIIPKPVFIPTNTTIDLNNSVIKLQPYDDRDYGKVMEVYNNMIAFVDCEDSHLINGIIEGDYFERKEVNYNYNEGTEENPVYKTGLANANGEHNNTITIYGGKYNSLDNLIVRQTTGYSLMNREATGHGKNGDLLYINAGFWDELLYLWENGDRKDLVNGVLVDCSNRVTSDYIDISSLVPYGAISVGRMLSNYPTSHYYEVKLSFFDENKNFIEEFIAYQAREVKIPSGTKYIRATLFDNLDRCKGQSFWILEPFHPEYIEYNNLTLIDNRTCVAPNLYKHFRMNNCKFIRSGNSITPLAIDAEDGGATMQDLFIENCEIVEKGESQTGDFIAVAGLNVVFQNNTNMSFGVRAEVVGATIRNNIFRTSCEISPGWRTNNTIRCYDNDVKNQNISVSWHNVYTSQVCIKNCSNIKARGGWDTDSVDCLVYYKCDNVAIGSNAYYKECIFHLETATDGTGFSVFDNCVFTCDVSTIKTLEIKSFNYGSMLEDMGEYNYCEFNINDNPLKIYSRKKDAFTKGKFSNCIFNSPTTLQFLYNNNMGDIQFNNCTFNSSLTIDLKDAKVQFNNCTFNRISYLNNGQLNSEFNN